jgi:xylulokinase
MHILGLDIGTTGCKAVLFDVEGQLVAKASREYAIAMPQPGWAEQDAELVWRLAQEVMRQAIHQAGVSEVVAIGLSVQGEAVVPVDARGLALRPMILGMDTRTEEQNAWLRERFGARQLFEWTGMPVHTINTLPKLLWLKENTPDLWRTAHRFLLYEDFLIQKMTGRAVISRCLASRTQCFDLHQDRWSPEILEALALEEQRLAEISDSGRVVGPMHSRLASDLGLSHPPLVVTGGHDQACGALGVGLTRPGLAMVSTGTAEVVEVALAEPVIHPALFEANLSCYAHVVPGLYLAMTLNHSGGLLLRWLRDAFCQGEVQQAFQSGADAYDLILAGASGDPTSLLVLPHFAGSGTPTFDTASKGAILGLTFSAGKTELAKAILEGLTYELRLNLEALKAGGVEISTLRAIGGGARSELWLQLKADITGIPVAAPRQIEAAAFGAAVLAGAGAGLFSSAAEAAEQFLRLERCYQPEPARQQRYDQRYHLYQQIYPLTAPILHQL